MRQLCRIVSSALGTRCTAGAEMATSVFRFWTIEIGPGIFFNRTVFIHMSRLDGEAATNGRRVGMSGCCASKDLGRRTTRGGRLLCKQDSQVGSIPTRSTKFRQSRMRGRYAPLKTERAAFNSLGWHQSGNGVMRCIRALGARGLSSILSSPTIFKRPCQRGLMAFATNEVYAGSNPAGRSKIVLQ
jgi:hypothetical protein